tara:strand:- start:16889 stop:17920 length:1032 start_codon:yes stop_codon:yes gene_type:complete
MSNVISLGDFNQFTDLTDAIQFVPNKWTRIGDMGLFTPRGTSQLSVTFDRVDGKLSALEARQRGVQPVYGSNEIVKTLSYATAYFPANDKVAPEDIQGRRRPGSADQTDMVTDAVMRKVENLRMAHAQTREYMEMQALKGLVKSPDGTVFADLYTDFGFTQKTVDFLLGTATTDVDSKIREMVRHIEDNAFSGGSIGGIRVMVSQEFFDKLITHATIRDAYINYQNSNQMGGGQVLRDDLRRSFVHQGVVFEEYRGSITKLDGTVERMIDAQEGHAFPTGIDGMFETWYSPAHHMDFVNTVGEEVYAWSLPARDGSGIEIFSQSAPLPLCKRPQALVKVSTSN